ncbi:hypothetical protein B9G53_09705 [Pseudanabaena sp. SR411]|nr:hypothetical protein B9G53_09705 [Pseudanabaena sp. SR411]
MRWEQKMATQAQQWSPSAPAGSDVTIERDEVYTRVGENHFPSESKGWTITFIERGSRYWIEAKAGMKTSDLFKQATSTAWSWAKTSQYIRWFTDSERRYAQQLWTMASVYLKSSEVTREYGHRKVWCYGLEVAMKIKGSQGNRRVEWVKPEHLYTAISDKSDVHANHNVSSG